ncbi:uncharacterized protein EDB91DRAFT_1255372 [Suillus paluster]|uniref:uncharacterized protein n=1 Tax=Suillus paluster TaxID=48578 RepID=UPI001B8788F7|nr:uncharacterized protein EDB91DRAFT_1255372 [Suillus paluster]KAG1724155.1 hypothetical protein EDB91DRAFT_1255372 [Suillus paluster]
MTSHSLTICSSVSSPPTSEAPNSSPILKSDSSSLRRTSLVTPNKPRIVSPPPTSEAPTSSPILRSSSSDLESSPIPMVSSHVPGSSSSILMSGSPILKSGPIRSSSLHTAHTSPFTTTVPSEGGPTSATKHGPRKRPHQYSLLEDDGLEDNGYFPTKRSKTLFTLFTCNCPADSAVYFMECMLELSCVSRWTFTTKMEYQRLRAEELSLIMAIVHDELEESKGHMTQTDLQIGSLQNKLYDAGVAVIGSKGRPGNQVQKEVEFGRLFPGHGHHEADDSCDSYDASHSDMVSELLECHSGI